MAPPHVFSAGVSVGGGRPSWSPDRRIQEESELHIHEHPLHSVGVRLSSAATGRLRHARPPRLPAGTAACAHLSESVSTCPTCLPVVLQARWTQLVSQGGLDGLGLDQLSLTLACWLSEVSFTLNSGTDLLRRCGHLKPVKAVTRS